MCPEGEVLSERERPCHWCKGTGKLPKLDECGLCWGTGLTSYSIGDYPVEKPRKKQTERKLSKAELLEQIVCLIKKM